MNKTVNINLAGIFFHIDEDAYAKLQRYLEAIKRSFTDSQGRSEIIADIESRIAELFNERIENNKQVIRVKEVDEVIAIMGQPEDYLVDDEIFEDEPLNTSSKTRTKKRLFRDPDDSYISGVSSGLGHYFGVDAVWVRLAWILLVLGAGTGILIYISLWIFVPEAKTTAEKLTMKGEPVNISNIEKKIKDGFDTVTETVSGVAKNVSDSVSKATKNVDTNTIKSSSKTFFDTLGDIILSLFKIFAKFIGLLLIIVGSGALLTLIITLLSISVIDIVPMPGIEMIEFFNAGNTPIWLASLLILFAIGIPFFFVFYLGLKILINNLKSIGKIAKFTLLGLWVMSVIGLIIVGVRQASEHAFNEAVIDKSELFISSSDTIKVKMVDNDAFKNVLQNGHGLFKIARDENNNRVLYNSEVNLNVKSTTDSLVTVVVEKSADGSDFDKAIERAQHINYKFNLENNTLSLDSYLTTNPENKFSNQEVNIILYIPINTIVYFSDSTKPYLNYRRHKDNFVSKKNTSHYLKILNDKAECLDCKDDEFDIEVNTPQLKIDDNSLEIRADDTHLKINHNGIEAEAEDVKVNINADGIEIITDN